MNIVVFLMTLYLLLAVSVGAWVDSDMPNAPANIQTSQPYQ